MRVRLAFLTLVACASSCVTVYQPVTSLQRPTVIDPASPNFKDMNIRVRCVPDAQGGADTGESEDLCRNMSALLSNQGAHVQTEVPEDADKPPQISENEEDESAAKDKKPRDTQPDLTIEIKSRKLHNDNSPWLWALCYLTLTLSPAITEATFAQDIVISDAEGFVLLSETLQARFIRYFGFAYWGINALMDLFRPKGEELIGNNHRRDFSRDFHRQISQLTFNATMRERVLHSFAK